MGHPQKASLTSPPWQVSGHLPQEALLHEGWRPSLCSHRPSSSGHGALVLSLSDVLLSPHTHCWGSASKGIHTGARAPGSAVSAAPRGHLLHPPQGHRVPVGTSCSPHQEMSWALCLLSPSFHGRKNANITITHAGSAPLSQRIPAQDVGQITAPF